MTEMTVSRSVTCMRCCHGQVSVVPHRDRFAIEDNRVDSVPLLLWIGGSVLTMPLRRLRQVPNAQPKPWYQFGMMNTDVEAETVVRFLESRVGNLPPRSGAPPCPLWRRSTLPNTIRTPTSDWSRRRQMSIPIIERGKQQAGSEIICAQIDDPVELET